MKKHIANAITLLRILLSVIMLFFSAFSAEFYIIYIICGFSDMIDGTIARKTNSTCEFGAKIDTLADFVFVTVAMIKILPTLDIPKWLCIWGAVIAIIKIGNIIWGYVSEKQFISLHTIMNKITGLLLFIFPLTLSFLELKYSLVTVCVMATFSAIQEGYFIGKGSLNK